MFLKLCKFEDNNRGTPHLVNVHEIRSIVYIEAIESHKENIPALVRLVWRDGKFEDYFRAVVNDDGTVGKFLDHSEFELALVTTLKRQQVRAVG